MDFDRGVVARGPALVRFAHALSGDRHLAEDLVQEVLLKAHRRWQRISGDPEVYLKVAVARQLVSWRRPRSAHERPTTVEDRPQAAESTISEQRDDLWRLLGRLSPRQRAVLVLRYWEGLADREIAALLGCREGTVRSSAARAFAVLRQSPEFAGLAVPEGTHR